ncbi:O-antigen ligase family protein [Ornithinimicrobium sp. Y1847]|uniref:O-antigen ligase family protein n=1 Tax=Ornithinimicrobium sp. Y1847 TaxID=3405419 RepID=UPI003B682DCC
MASSPRTVWKLDNPDPIVDPRAESTRLLYFLLAVFLPLRLEIVGLPSGTLAALGIGALGLLQPGDPERRAPLWFGPLLFSVPAWMATSGLLNDEWDWRRLGTCLAWAMVAFVLGTGRVHVPSVARGAVFGLLAALVTGSMAAGAGYEGRLSTYAGDPNATAMAALSVGLAAAAWSSLKRRPTFLILALVVIIVGLTESRTGWLALPLAVAWVVHMRKWNIVGAALTAWAVVYLFENLPDSIRYWGPFAERVGSDELRERILGIETEMVSRRPLVGLGPGTARADLEGQTFFFHSSYLSVRVEGGYILLTVVVLTLLGVFLRLARAEKTWRTGLLQAAIIGQAITAANIGESLLTPSCATMIGLAMWWSLAQPRGVFASSDEEGSTGHNQSVPVREVAARPNS